MSAPTPMMRQYLEIKADYPDAILFFRLGDFYEMFLEDAVVASRVLDIALTSRNKGAADEIPLCGIPFHSYQPYLAKLVENGYKVAVCEQVEDPRSAKGIVKREVVRVVTPGLIVDSETLTPTENNFLLAIAFTIVMAGSEWLLRLAPDLAGSWLVLRGMAEYGIVINFVLMLFNLIPIPPLDGSHVFAYLLPTRLAYRYRQIGMGGTIIVFILLWVTGFTFLSVPLGWLLSAAMQLKGMLV